MRICVLLLLCVAVCVGQTVAPTPAPAAQPQSAFAETTYNFALSPITLPGTGTTLSGAESDVMVNFTQNNAFGATTLISNNTFVGGRYDRTFPSVANFLQSKTALTGYNYQFYVTGSVGVVRSAVNHWGERAGVGLRWAPAGSTSFSVAFEATANRLPGIADSWIPAIAVSPQFRF
jgi:hypothetical protein